MNILLATSEAVPFAKTGGLADVSGALPLELARLGHRPSSDHARLPAGAGSLASRSKPTSTSSFRSPSAARLSRGSLLHSRLPGSKVPVYLVEQDEYFDRDGFYGSGGQDYIDNCERFVFFLPRR